MKPNRLSLLLSALLLALPRFAHSATLPTYDPLDYGAGYDLGAQSDTNGITTVFSWTHIGVTGARPGTINVASGNLFYAGLTNSVGNSITNPAGPSQGLRYQSRNVNVYSGGIFYSALIKLNSLGTLATGDQILALNNTSTTNQTTDPTTIPGRLFVRKDSVDGTKYNIGVAWGSAVVTPTYASGQFAVGSTHLVVVKYDNTAAKASLWLDPNPADLGAASAPAGNIDNTTGSGGAVIQSLLVINQTATTPSYAIDDVRLGLSWASVTTPGAPGFTAQPVNATTNYGSNATFSVTAVGATVAGTISYVWKTNGVPTSDGPTGSGSVISGSTTATLTISGVSQADEVSYSVTASNLNGATDSSSAVLSVNDPRIVTQPTVSNRSPALL